MRRIGRGLLALSLAVGCSMNRSEADSPEDFSAARKRMVQEQLEARGLRDRRVLDVMAEVPRHEFVPQDVRARAYADGALPIGYGQTISQPYVVAAMTAALEVGPEARVLEVGTGSGYQAAVLSRLVAEVYTIEIVPELAARAARDLARLGYANVHARAGDGYRGWPEHAPFDGIVVTAAPERIPQPLVDQLAMGGRMIVPVGRGVQDLTLLTRGPDGVSSERLMGVLFVPMTGEVREAD